MKTLQDAIDKYPMDRPFFAGVHRGVSYRFRSDTWHLSNGTYDSWKKDRITFAFLGGGTCIFDEFYCIDLFIHYAFLCDAAIDKDKFFRTKAIEMIDSFIENN